MHFPKNFFPAAACPFNDDTSPSPNYNPGTPGYTTQESPNSNPYTPATPGSVYNPQEGYSPYQPSPSPSAGYQCKFHSKSMFRLEF